MVNTCGTSKIVFLQVFGTLWKKLFVKFAFTFSENRAIPIEEKVIFCLNIIFIKI